MSTLFVTSWLVKQEEPGLDNNQIGGGTPAVTSLFWNTACPFPIAGQMLRIFNNNLHTSHI